jgi:hypothetical protein
MSLIPKSWAFCGRRRQDATFACTFNPRRPVEARAPPTVAYEYYTPANRASAKPVELEVIEK